MARHRPPASGWRPSVSQQSEPEGLLFTRNRVFCSDRVCRYMCGGARGGTCGGQFTTCVYSRFRKLSWFYSVRFDADRAHNNIIISFGKPIRRDPLGQGTNDYKETLFYFPFNLLLFLQSLGGYGRRMVMIWGHAIYCMR